jgi:S1-C subfamily serine protease
LIAAVLFAALASRSALATEEVAVPKAVLAAQADRVATIERISRPTIAIFDRKGQGGGSGVLISPDGYAVTNYHVTAPCGPAMRCGLSDGRFLDAVLVGLDPGGDVALIKVLGSDEAAFPAAEFGDSDAVRVGDWVYVAGNPFLLADDFKPSISYGIISGVRRYQYPAGTLLEYTDCLQTDAAVNPGNSGGPLFDSAGRLIGINGRCSFEKRGRVNVGVGYSVSINQVKRFTSHLMSGRLVDHASLGAIVSTDSDGRVVVDDILEDSDAYRRGLRYGDEIVRFGGRDISTANALKNMLGTYPQGWRVPVVFRRDGKEHERLIRLSGVHREGELAAMLEGGREEPKPELPERPDKPPSPEPRKATKPRPKKAADLPDEVQKLYESRTGYANYWFNRYELQRVWNNYLSHGDFAGTGWNWNIRGKNEAGGKVEIVLSEDHSSIVTPVGKSEAEFTMSLSDTLSPPRSGGLLATLHLWQRLVLIGPRQFGDVYYLGTLPFPTEQQLADCLVAIYGGVETRFYFDPAMGDLVGVEMQSADDQDPCEIYFSDFRLVEGRRLPHRWVIRHGDESFADLRISSYEWPSTIDPSAADPEARAR